MGTDGDEILMTNFAWPYYGNYVSQSVYDPIPFAKNSTAMMEFLWQRASNMIMMYVAEEFGTVC